RGGPAPHARAALAARGVRGRDGPREALRDRPPHRAAAGRGTAGDPRHAGVRACDAAVRRLSGTGAVRRRDRRRAVRDADRHPPPQGRAGRSAGPALHAGAADHRAARGLPGPPPAAHARESRRDAAPPHRAQRRVRGGLGALLRGADVGAGLLHRGPADAAVPAARPAVPGLPRRARRLAPRRPHDAAAGHRLSCGGGPARTGAPREPGSALVHHPHATDELPGRQTPDPRAALGSPAEAGRTLPPARLPCGPARQRHDPAGAGARGTVAPAGRGVRARAGSVLVIPLALLALLVGRAEAVEPSDKYSAMPASTGLTWSSASFKSTRDGADLSGWWFDGKGDGPVIVLFDRSEGSMGDLLPVAGEFVGRGFTVMTFDYRDFGPSGPGAVDSLVQLVFASRWVNDAEGALRFARS